jgi:hypothetical protein
MRTAQAFSSHERRESCLDRFCGRKLDWNPGALREQLVRRQPTLLTDGILYRIAHSESTMCPPDLIGAPKAPRKPGRSQHWSEPDQAANLVGLTSSSLLELVIGIARGFIASGSSRTRSTCRSPFSRFASLT